MSARPRRRATSLLLALFALVALGAIFSGSASAQTEPRAPEPTRDALVAARTVRAPDGRVRRAWGIVEPRESARGDWEERARAFLAAHASELALAPDATLALDRVSPAAGLTIVRFVRVAHGGPVLGSSVVVRFAGRGVDYVSLSFVDGRVAARGRRVGRDVATRAALDAVPFAEPRAIALEPAALEREGSIVPVFVVEVGGLFSERRRVVVDGADGAVLFVEPRNTDALGRVWASNPVTDGVTSDVELPSLTSRDRLTGRYVRVEQCNPGDGGCAPTQLATADVDGNFLFDPEEPSFDDPFAEVQAYHHVNRVAAYFRDTHGFTWMCGSDTLMHAYVNYGESAGAPYDNAAYSPGAGSECGFIFFGQGSDRDFVYDSDVVYHEYTHSVVDGVTGLGGFLLDALGVSYQPGAINEGMADYFAATISGDPRMAEYFEGSAMVGSEEGALRRLDNELVCPDDLVGEVHFDGRIWGGLTWQLREALGPEKNDALVFATLASLDMLPSYADLADALLATAAALETEGTLTAEDRATVEDAATARGIVDCERVAARDGGAERLGYSGLSDLTATTGGSIAPTQYRIEVPADATRIAFHVEQVSAGGHYRLYLREDVAVRFVPSRRPPLISTGELALDAMGRAVLTRETSPALPRCHTLYVAVVTEDLRTIGQSLYRISAELETSGLDESCEEPDAGAPLAIDAGTSGADASALYTPAGGGCACRAGGSPAAPRSTPALLGVLALLGWTSSRLRARRSAAARGRPGAAGSRSRPSPGPR